MTATKKMWPRLVRLEALWVGVLLTLAQLTLALLNAPSRDLGRAYEQLCQWDCRWYEVIARDGYHSPIPPVAQNPAVSNVAFFPAYPFLARALCLGLKIHPVTALLVVAQLLALLFWITLWTILRDWNTPRALGALITALIFCHPAAFMLVTGYSESLFLACMLLFLRYSGKQAIVAAFSGMLMSASRIVGVVVSIYPLLTVGNSDGIQRRFQTHVLPAIAAMAGAAGFLLYCQLEFGAFDLYMQTQRIGWGIAPDYGAILNWSDFRFRFERDRAALLVSAVGFILATIIELSLIAYSSSGGWTRRAPLYLIGFGIFFISVSGLKSVGFQSFIRYSLPCHILLLLCLADLLRQAAPRLVWRRAPRLTKLGLKLGAAAALFAFWIQIELPFLNDFLRGRWFA